MPRRRGTRSIRDAVAWTCNRGHHNPVERCLFFDIPTFRCGCRCGEEYPYNFENCLGEITVNGHKVLGDIPDEGFEGDCIQHTFGKQLEVTKRVKAILQKKDPNSVPKMNSHDLKYKYERRVGKVKCDSAKEVVHTALILKEQGIRSMDSNMVYKASNVSVVRRTDYSQIARDLANGFPLHAGIFFGRTLRWLRFCRKYKPPRLGDFSKARRNHISAHAILLVGAGRRRGKWYFYFLNTCWRRFCLRFNSKGDVISRGIGKVVADRLFRNLIRLSRFKEESSGMSLRHEDGIEISEHNKQLMDVEH